MLLMITMSVTDSVLSHAHKSTDIPICSISSNKTKATTFFTPSADLLLGIMPKSFSSNCRVVLRCFKFEVSSVIER